MHVICSVFFALAAPTVVSQAPQACSDHACSDAFPSTEHAPARALLVTKSHLLAAQNDDPIEDDIEEETEAPSTESGSDITTGFDGEKRLANTMNMSAVDSDLPDSWEGIPVVQFAVFLNNLDSVSARTGHWTGDVIMRSSYQRAKFHKPVSLELISGKVDFRTEQREWNEGDNLTRTEHNYVNMQFDGSFDQFPFDEQTLTIAVQLNGMAVHEGRFAEWPGFSGVRPYDTALGRQFQTQQFYSKSWTVHVSNHKEFGIPYWKSRAELRVVLGRFHMFYFVTCWFIPSLAIFFAMGVFFLPLSLIVPRVTISFTSFLAIFVHMKQMTALVPDGVWCWLMTDLIFYCLILGAAIGSNVASGRLNFLVPRLAEMNDAFIRVVLPMEFVGGQILLVLFRRNHVCVGGCVILCVLVLHGFPTIRLFHMARSSGKEKSFGACLMFWFPCMIGGAIASAVGIRRATSFKQDIDGGDDNGDIGLSLGASAGDDTSGSVGGGTSSAAGGDGDADAAGDDGGGGDGGDGG